MVSIRTASLVAAVVLVCLSVFCGASVTLDNWSAPLSENGLTYASPKAPAAASIKGQVWIAYSSGEATNPPVEGYLFLAKSTQNDGTTFPSTVQTMAEYRTFYDPELVTMWDSGLGQESLLLLWGDKNGAFNYAVLNPTTGLWPTNPSLVSGITNVGGDIDAIATPTASSGGKLTLLAFVYVNGNGNPAGYSNAYSGSATLVNGVLSGSSAQFGVVNANGNGAVQWQSASEAAIFFLPPYGIGVIQSGTGYPWVFTTQTPTQANSFVHINVDGANWGQLASPSSYSGFNTIQFPLASACDDLIGLFYIPYSGYGVGYVLLAPTTPGGDLTGSTSPHTISTVSSTTVTSQPIAAYMPESNKIYVYFVDMTDYSDPIINVIYTTPGL